LVIEHVDALEWLGGLSDGIAALVVYDPPYAVGSPVRGREDGAAGSVFAPFSFLSRTLAEASRVLRPGGIAMIFADWRRMPDLAYMATTSGLRASTCVAWIRKRPGTGGLFRSAWDPILIASRGIPGAVDRSAVRNVVETLDEEPVVEADYPSRRAHPYEKPAGVFRHVFPRVCRAGDLVVDPFAGSGVTARVAEEYGLRWLGCDIDPRYATDCDAEMVENAFGPPSDSPAGGSQLSEGGEKGVSGGNIATFGPSDASRKADG
jgi:DNA modification methylase